MTLTAKERKSLLAASHAMKPLMTIGAGGLSDGTLEHIRRCFAGRELVKLRVQADDSAACDAVAAEIVRRLPCELVRRVGRVLILYQPPAASGPPG